MATNTRVELGPGFDCTLCDCGGGLDEFEPEVQRGGLWLRVASPTPADVQRWEPYAAPARARAWPIGVPVVVAAAIAGAAVSWLGMQAGGRVVVPAPRPATPVAVGGRAAVPEVTAIAGDVERRAVPAALPRAESSVAAPEPTATALDPGLEQALAAISASYRSLDAAALTAVWPAADTASLASTFSELKYQSLSFEQCRVRPNGGVAAIASCAVAIAAAPKAGDQALERRRESWTLVLNRSGDRWTIAGVSTRPAAE